jgi:hypothetical protein
MWLDVPVSNAPVVLLPTPDAGVSLQYITKRLRVFNRIPKSMSREILAWVVLCCVPETPVLRIARRRIKSCVRKSLCNWLPNVPQSTR